MPYSQKFAFLDFTIKGFNLVLDHFRKMVYRHRTWQLPLETSQAVRTHARGQWFKSTTAHFSFLEAKTFRHPSFLLICFS